MTEGQENELLRDILLDAAAEEFAPEFSSAEQVETSPKFQKSMQSLLLIRRNGLSADSGQSGNELQKWWQPSH